MAMYKVRLSGKKIPVSSQLGESGTLCRKLQPWLEQASQIVDLG